MPDTPSTGINLDAIYQGDPVAIGDAIRNLAIASAKQQGVLPVLTDRVIVPTLTENGLLVESENGTPLFTSGGPFIAPGGAIEPGRQLSTFSTDMLLTKGLFVDEWYGMGAQLATSSLFDPFHTGSDTSPSSGLQHTAYRITSAAFTNSISFIYRPYGDVAGFGTIPDGQVVFIANQAGKTLLFGDPLIVGTGANSFQSIVGGPLTIGDGGCIAVVYDKNHVNLNTAKGGWRIVGYSGLGWASYTPSWTSSGTQPDPGTGATLQGAYRADGKTCRFWARLILGTGFSFGTGNLSLTLPIQGAWPANNRFPCEVLFIDSSTAWSGVGRIHNTAGVLFQVWQVSGSHLVIATPDATTPFTWAAGDSIYVSGEYPI